MADVARTLLTSLGYSDVTLLGSGAFGSVYDCTDREDRRCAIKVATDEHGRELAAREAATMALLPAHPNVMPLYSFNAEPEGTILSMPLATGGDTLRLMQDRGCTPLPEADARSLFSQLLDGLAHLHAAGIVHRDIKCENLLLTGPRRRTLVIADFGFAGQWKKGSRLHEAWGSLHYSAPEICGEQSYEGPEVDVWSAGVSLYAWVTGRLPFGGDTRSHTADLIKTSSFQMPTTLSPQLVNLIRGMLTVDPKQRLTIEEIKSHPWMASPLMPRNVSDPQFDQRRRASAVPPVVVERRRSSLPNSGRVGGKLVRVVTVLKNAVLRLAS